MASQSVRSPEYVEYLENELPYLWQSDCVRVNLIPSPPVMVPYMLQGAEHEAAAEDEVVVLSVVCETVVLTGVVPPPLSLGVTLAVDKGVVLSVVCESVELPEVGVPSPPLSFGVTLADDEIVVVIVDRDELVVSETTAYP